MTEPKLIITQPKPTYNVAFWEGDKEIGKLSWENGVMVFEGDMEDSAKKFFDFLKGLTDGYIKDYLKKE